jgi:hypothetical protein
MKRWLAVLLCLAFLPAAAAFAQQPGDPATKEDVQKLFELQNGRKLFASIMTAAKQQASAATESAMKKQYPNATPEEKAKLNAFMNDRMDKILQTLPLEDLLEAMIPAYQHHFTHGEMQELIHFYSSPVGKKLIAETPAIMTEGMQAAAPVMQKWQSAQMDDLQVAALDFAKTLKAEKTPPASLSQPLN